MIFVKWWKLVWTHACNQKRYPDLISGHYWYGVSALFPQTLGDTRGGATD